MDDQFFITRQEAIDLANWFVEVDLYKRMLNIFFEEVENAVLLLTGDELLEIKR